MLEIIKNDIWKLHEEGKIIAIPTNGVINSNNELVMGKGIALEAKLRYPDLPRRLGILVGLTGNYPYYIKKYNLFSFPTKYHWKDKSDIELIKKSLYFISDYCRVHFLNKIYIPKIGCGCGGLDWNDVKHLIEKLYEEYFIVVDNKGDEPDVK